jgi:phosphopantetheinyl transferase
MVTSDLPVGLDIQNPVPQIRRIQTKFCRSDELEAVAIAPNPLDLLTHIWSSKEALFKIYGSEVDFREEMAFSTEEQDHIFLLKDGHMVRHELFTRKHEDMWMTLCLAISA